jgi:hypothetical protein
VRISAQVDFVILRLTRKRITRNLFIPSDSPETCPTRFTGSR